LHPPVVAAPDLNLGQPTSSLAHTTDNKRKVLTFDEGSALGSSRLVVPSENTAAAAEEEGKKDVTSSSAVLSGEKRAAAVATEKEANNKKTTRDTGMCKTIQPIR
jgi:hypothetical protein